MIPDVTVRFVGPEKGPKRTFPGPFQLVTEFTFEEVPHPDVIVVPADMSSTTDERVLSWLRSAHETSRWATSVCAGALTLPAAGNSAGIDMALFLAGEIAGPDVARAIQLVMEYDPQPPFDSGSLAKAKPDTIAGAARLIHDAMVEADAPPGMLALLSAATPG